MRLVLGLLLLAGCDRVFGLGDPYEDAPRPRDLAVLDTSRGGMPDGRGDGRTALPVPIAHWSFDGDLADDVSQANGACTTSGSTPCTFVIGQHGMALHLDGSSCASLPFTMQPDAFTIVVWTKPADGAVENSLLELPVSMPTSTQDSWYLAESSSGFELDTTDLDTYLASASVPNGTWTNVAVTFDPTSEQFYDDTMPLTAKMPSSGVAYGTATQLYLGCRGGAGAVTYFAGDVDELYIFDHPLTRAEISDFQ